ncbi:hypothetical protein PCE1_003030 [Barthelona sp. PCE]
MFIFNKVHAAGQRGSRIPERYFQRIIKRKYAKQRMGIKSVFKFLHEAVKELGETGNFKDVKASVIQRTKEKKFDVAIDFKEKKNLNKKISAHVTATPHNTVLATISSSISPYVGSSLSAHLSQNYSKYAPVSNGFTLKFVDDFFMKKDLNFDASITRQKNVTKMEANLIKPICFGSVGFSYDNYFGTHDVFDFSFGVSAMRHFRNLLLKRTVKEYKLNVGLFVRDNHFQMKYKKKGLKIDVKNFVSTNASSPFFTQRQYVTYIPRGFDIKNSFYNSMIGSIKIEQQIGKRLFAFFNHLHGFDPLDMSRDSLQMRTFLNSAGFGIKSIIPKVPLELYYCIPLTTRTKNPNTRITFKNIGFGLTFE